MSFDEGGMKYGMQEDDPEGIAVDNEDDFEDDSAAVEATVATTPSVIV